MSNQFPRFLVVGLGSIGQRHLGNLRQLVPDSRIAALRHRPDSVAVPGCDLQLHDMDEVSSFAPDAAIIAGPASTHIPAALALAGMGVPLLIEKPISDSTDGLTQLIQAVEGRGLVAMIGYNLRFKRSLARVRQLVDGGSIGQVLAVRAEVGQYLPDWRPSSDYRRTVSAQAGLGGGALLELSHEIDYLYWLFGMPARVTCRGGKLSELEIDVEDVVELCMEYDSPKRLVSVHLDFVQRVPYRGCRFVGTEGTLVWDGIGDVVTLLHPGAEPRHEQLATADRNETYVAELEHFLECIRLGRKPDIDLRSGYDVLAIVESAKRSLHNATIERPMPYAC